MECTLYPDDIVAKKADIKQLAVVERTRGDVDTHSPYPGKTEQEHINHDRSISNAAFRQFMKDGIPPKSMVLVRWRDEAIMELLPISKLSLVDRSLLIGDIVKRRIDDAMSGCVLNTFTKCTLQPMCDVTYHNSQTLKGLLPPGKWDPSSSRFCIYPNGASAQLKDISASELQYAETVSEDDLVIYKDWIGRIEAITNNIRVRLLDNSVVEISDEIGEHVDGAIGSFCIGDIVKAKKADLRTGQWIYGQYNANTPPVGTVVSLRTVQVQVLWMERRLGAYGDQEPPHILESGELDSPDFQVYNRTQRPTNELEGSETISNSEIDVRLNLRVRFRDLANACLKYNTSENTIPRLDRKDHLGYDLNVFDVIDFRTNVTVQWQDLSVTTERGVDLVPDGSIDDEHAAWPGEIATTLGFVDTPNVENAFQPKQVGVVQSVNAEERMAKMRWSADSFIVYLKEFGLGGGLAPIMDRRISPTYTAEEEVSLYDIEAPAATNVRRGDIVLIADSQYNCMKEAPKDTTWLGEIVDTLLDGTLVVRLGAAAEVRDVVLRREHTMVAVRSDGTGETDAWLGDEMEDGDSLDDGTEGADFGDEWNSESETEDEVEARYEDENGMLLDEDDVENEEWESADEERDEDNDAKMHDAPEHQTPTTSEADTGTAVQDLPTQIEHTPEKSSPYLVLEGDVPSDHRYYRETSTSTSGHTKRTQKEHKILRNPATLPEGVYIRTWESRLDLLRVLLIGPTETPYANAPFIVDFYLPPQFPTEPPHAHFHSWPAEPSIGTVGRCNPNLYEDGKICLSLLGTWEGGKGENWNAARSTLLQVIVSLLGLVLVREPYYNEAGYEGLVGTEASKRPSALYSERVFLRTKGFLAVAISFRDNAPGLRGLEDVIHWLYRDAAGPRLLDASIREVSEVLERSQGTREPDGLTVLSKGATIPAKRVLDILRDLASRSGAEVHP